MEGRRTATRVGGSFVGTPTNEVARRKTEKMSFSAKEKMRRLQVRVFRVRRFELAVILPFAHEKSFENGDNSLIKATR